MTAIYKLWEVGQAVELGTTYPLHWFRGHARVYGELTPRIFRQQWQDQKYAHLKPNMEFNIIENFKRQAPALARTPDYNDHLAWLFLMQHYGAPTRLLDWTESVLIGLYFAVNGAESEDGELWALCPTELNRLSIGQAKTPTPDNPLLRYLVEEPRRTDPNKLAQELEIKRTPRGPIAVMPPLHFARMVAQHSVFTIHPKPTPGTAIPELLPQPNYLVRYLVPQKHKRKLLLDLGALGIMRKALFPDLEALSETIVSERGLHPATPPDPPNWGEPDDATTQPSAADETSA